MPTIEFWYWWVAAVILVIIEVLAPGTFFLWMGISAAIIGFLLWLFPDMSWEWQFLLFSVISLASIVLWQIRLRKHPTSSSDETLNKRNLQYVGRTFTLVDPIVDGYGSIHVDDTIWRVSGPDCAGGIKVKVVNADGSTLIVEPVDTPAP
jgi:inner membrane protein